MIYTHQRKVRGLIDEKRRSRTTRVAKQQPSPSAATAAIGGRNGEAIVLLLVKFTTVGIGVKTAVVAAVGHHVCQRCFQQRWGRSR